jgi:transcriptional regulator with XRE-family HTH domain
MKPIAEQLREAFEASGWSVRELLDKSGLSIDRSSLSRKLSGQLRTKTEEAEAIARALGVLVTAGRSARAS